MYIANPVGRKGEDLAKEFLLKKGYHILETNYRKSYGEIDIIAIDLHSSMLRTKGRPKGGILVFIEVKTRISMKFGLPIESISHFKLQSLMKTAEYYKSLHPKLPESLRIDAIIITLSRNEDVLEIEQIENISI